MKYTITLFTILVSTSAFAGQTQVLEPFSKAVEINMRQRPSNIWIYSATKTKVATKVEVMEVQCTSTDSGNCTERKVLESAPGFEIRVGYDVDAHSVDGNNVEYAKLFVRAEDAPAALAATTKNPYLNAKKANALFGLNTQTQSRIERNVDYSRSHFCEFEERVCRSAPLKNESCCRESVVYKNVIEQYVVVSPIVK